jgi:hypothetical protein
VDERLHLIFSIFFLASILFWIVPEAHNFTLPVIKKCIECWTWLKSKVLPSQHGLSLARNSGQELTAQELSFEDFEKATVFSPGQ